MSRSSSRSLARRWTGRPRDLEISILSRALSARSSRIRERSSAFPRALDGFFSRATSTFRANVGLGARKCLHPQISGFTLSIGMRALKSPQGFTIAELMVVVAIIVILMSLLFPAVQGALEAAKKAQAKNDVTQIATAIVAYDTEYGRLPSTNPAPEVLNRRLLQRSDCEQRHIESAQDPLFWRFSITRGARAEFWMAFSLIRGRSLTTLLSIATTTTGLASRPMEARQRIRVL